MQDTDNPPTTAMPDQAGKAQSSSLPWRARLSLMRQRILLTVRWWFRLPIDDVRDQQLDTLLNTLAHQSEALQTAVGLMKSISVRLNHYEKNIPRMRELKRDLELQAMGIRSKQNGAVYSDGSIKP